MKTLRAVVVFLVLFGLAACQGLPFAVDGVLPPPVVVADGSAARRALNAQVYDAATGWIETHYYDPEFNGRDWRAMTAAARAEAIAAPTEQAFYAALSALVDELGDRHTAVTSPSARAREEAARTGRSGATYGLTAVRRGDRYFVTRVRPDGPAAEAGVQIGWRVLTINGSDALRSVSPREGASDAFVFEDENGVVRRAVITAAVLEPRPQQAVERRPDGVLVLRFDAFDRVRLDWFQTQIDAALADRPAGIVIDLRDNPGGLAAALGDMTARFYRDPIDFMLMKGRFINTMLHTARAEAVWDGPVAVLVGPGSASASELLAALLQETGRGLVVGQPTAGAVIGSRPVNLPDGGEMSLSLRTVLTGQQRRALEGVGVTPDIVVEPSLEDLRSGRDPALEAAATAVLGL